MSIETSPIRHPLRQRYSDKEAKRARLTAAFWDQVRKEGIQNGDTVTVENHNHEADTTTPISGKLTIRSDKSEQETYFVLVDGVKVRPRNVGSRITKAKK